MSVKAQLVYDYIENKILSGEYQQGDKIPSEAKLGEILNVSRVSTRSGLEKLITVGLLTKQKFGGTYVSLPQKDNYLKVLTPALMMNFDYIQMLELRQALDALSIELCIENINETVINHLKDLLKEMNQYKEDDNFFMLDRKFHLMISKYSYNTLLHNINEIMWDVLEQQAIDQYRIIGNEQRIIEHTKILDAIITGDRELARIYSIRHLSRTIKDVKNGE